MPALEPLTGLRVVARPGALDAATWTADGATGVTVLRFAPDDAFAIGATGVDLDDPHAIVEDEHGFVGGWCSFDDLRPKTEWAPPLARPALAQGSIAGVPAKVWLPGGDQILLVASAAHADVLAERLGWRR